MSMAIINGVPPNYKAIIKVFPFVGTEKGKQIIFTYGEDLYNPAGAEIPMHLMVHEGVHSRQQTNPKKWWKQYLEDVNFRLEQELEAYATQYNFICSVFNDEGKKALLNMIALDLSGEMYGSMVSYQKAESLIRNKAKVLEAQAKAKELGHCLCSLDFKCPCKVFLQTEQCKCSGDQRMSFDEWIRINK